MTVRDAEHSKLRASLSGGGRVAAVVLALLLVLVPAAQAGTYGPVGCSLNTGYACTSTERHTYDSNQAYAPSAGWAYIASWLRNPSTGTDIDTVWGYGLAYGYYRANTDLFLDGYWGNYSGSSPVTVQGTFDY